MADSKITDLTAVDAPIGTDIYAMVDDPGGTPVTKKVTFAQAATYIMNSRNLYQPSANVLEQRNSTAPQTFNIYNTYTDASNYERGFIRYSSNVLEIGHESAGTGNNGRDWRLYAGGNIIIGATGTNIVIAPASGISVTNARNFSFTGSYVGQVVWDSIGIGRSATGVAFVSNGSTGGGALEFREQTAPSAPSTNNVRIYAQDNGGGKTQLMALFATGAAQQIAIEP